MNLMNEGVLSPNELDDRDERREEAEAPGTETMENNWKEICAKCMEGEIEPRNCEYYGEPNGCNSPIYGEHPSTPNAAAMRSCLMKILAEMIDLGGMERGRKACFSPDAIAEEIRQAFVVPPRNCDRFATVDDARKAYEEYRGDYIMRASNKFDFPMEFEAWLFAPATEGGDDENA